MDDMADGDWESEKSLQSAEFHEDKIYKHIYSRSRFKIIFRFTLSLSPWERQLFSYLQLWVKCREDWSL